MMVWQRVFQSVRVFWVVQSLGERFVAQSAI
jgi:hypothetical protein